MKKITFLLFGVFLLFLTNGDRSYANTEEGKYLSEDVITFLTGRDFVTAHVILNRDYDVENLTEEELNILAATILNDIYNSKFEDVQPFYSPNLPLANRLNKKEIALAALNPYEATHVYFCTDIAETAAIDIFLAGNADDTNANAFKHAYWNALMSRNIGVNAAEKWATAHEYDNPNALSTEMDLINNIHGRTAYEVLAKNNSWPSDYTTEVYILFRLDSGYLIRIVNGKLAVTDNTGKR